MNHFLIVAAALVFSGCAMAQKEAPPPPPPLPPAKIVGDSYCSAAGKQEWSPKDTPKTIDGIRQRNAGYEKRCEKGTTGG